MASRCAASSFHWGSCREMPLPGAELPSLSYHSRMLTFTDPLNLLTRTCLEWDSSTANSPSVAEGLRILGASFVSSLRPRFLLLLAGSAVSSSGEGCSAACWSTSLWVCSCRSSSSSSVMSLNMRSWLTSLWPRNVVQCTLDTVRVVAAGQRG